MRVLTGTPALVTAPLAADVGFIHFNFPEERGDVLVH